MNSAIVPPFLITLSVNTLLAPNVTAEERQRTRPRMKSEEEPLSPLEKRLVAEVSNRHTPTTPDVAMQAPKMFCQLYFVRRRM